MQANPKTWTLVQRELLARSLRALAHPVRLSILELLIDRGWMNVTDIYTELGLDQSSVSHHLSLMRDRKIISCRREGKHIIYFMESDQYIRLVNSINRINLQEELLSYN